MPRKPDPALRDRLLDAATAEFAERGYAGAKLEGIGERAGVTKGGVYFHFAGKEALFFAALDRWRTRLRGAVARAGAPVVARSGRIRLEAFLQAWLEAHRQDLAGAGLIRVLATGLQGGFTAELRDDTRREQRWLRSELRELLAAGQRDGSLFFTDVAQTGFVLASALEGAVLQYLAAPREVAALCQPEVLAEQLAAAWTPRTSRSIAPTDAAGRAASAELPGGA